MVKCAGPQLRVFDLVGGEIGKKEGTDAESGRGQNFGLQNWAENVEDLLQEVDASRSLTRA